MQEILDESNDVFFFNRLKVPDKHKNKGFGTQLLQKTLNLILWF